MPPISEACALSEGKTFIGTECLPRKYVERLNRVDAVFCDLKKRIRKARGNLYRYCNPQPSSSSTAPSSSADETCILDQPEPVDPIYQYLISPNDLDEDAWTILQELEQEVCATLRKITLFESQVIVPCGSSSSSSAFVSSSSSSLPPPSSSSSESPPSSSSSEPPPSSSSSSEPSCAEGLNIASFCSYYPNYTLHSEPTVPGYGDCYYKSNIITGPSSSSSSGAPHYLILRYNLTTNIWEIWSNDSGVIATYTTGTPTNPRGSYEYTVEACVGAAIFVF